jgi:hypothetical protein
MVALRRVVTQDGQESRKTIDTKTNQNVGIIVEVVKTP